MIALVVISLRAARKIELVICRLNQTGMTSEDVRNVTDRIRKAGENLDKVSNE
jgi:hypothetical protein